MNQNFNKQIVTEFYKKVIGEHDLKYAREIVTDGYIQHNPNVKTGKEGFIEAIEYLRKLPKPINPTKSFIRIIADNEYVAMHMGFEFGGEKKIVLELFRLEDGLIAEHWDAIQGESEIGVNGNSEIKGPLLIEDRHATILNKKIVEEFTKQVLIERKFDLLPDFVAPSLIQHNPKVENGLDALSEYYNMVDIREVKRIIGQGNFVVTQSKTVLNSEDHALYDIYRLEDRLIVEHWSVSQIIPEVMAHSNGMI